MREITLSVIRGFMWLAGTVAFADDHGYRSEQCEGDCYHELCERDQQVCISAVWKKFIRKTRAYVVL